MSKSYNLKNLNTLNTVFLLGSPLVALLGVLLWLKVDGFTWQIPALAVIFYFATGIGITAGYHRLIAHRAYKANSFYKAIMLILGGSALQNSALKWCNDHRVHHGKVDTEHDPYNINEGFFYAHMGWILLQENIDDFRYSKDLLNDKLVMLQHKYYMPMIVFFSFILPGIIGHLWVDSFLGGFFVAGFARAVIVHHCTFFINSLCHMVGTRPYDKEQTARDSWLMALFTFGEGYHNYHHTFQSDYRNGIRWYHYDPTKWLIWTASKFGFATNLRRTKEVDIIAKMIESNLSGIEEQTASNPTMAELSNQILTKAREVVARIKESGANATTEFNELLLLLKQSRALIS
ncbi:fatty acid desaturase [Bacteriovorax sp. Seq25_V]|uniref:acyl-CoA desaturase n=1 Tax=Bacteriovorax sp. Seq25_V TaxID=1201288 RepID=UPI00038A535F|nr:fatty acid desaturase [Bacteriovorax sp. Seq25_V]EQC44378.1 stearoyl-CoA 9-desaturase [Bacteriovorax sp. Seq25_V]